MSHTTTATESRAEIPRTEAPPRCVVVVNDALSIGHAANAVGVLSVTLGTLVGGLPGEDLIDADVTLIDFPVQGQHGEPRTLRGRRHRLRRPWMRTAGSRVIARLPALRDPPEGGWV